MCTSSRAFWCLDIRLDNRGEHGSLKNLRSERKVPLHPAVKEEGFLKYVAKLPKNGPLFSSRSGQHPVENSAPVSNQFGEILGTGTASTGDQQVAGFEPGFATR